MKDIQTIIVQNTIDRGGMHDVCKAGTTITHNNIEYTYLASGLMRHVFRNG